jgi:fructosamine-3-kinase
VPLPEVLAIGGEGGRAFLALEWIEPGHLARQGAERFGTALAALHRLGAPAHGWLPAAGCDQGGETLRLGSLTLAARSADSWPRAYAEQRLIPLARLCRERATLSASGAAAVAAVAERIEELAGPEEPPARLHGDLWSGNVHADARGEAWLIDPAAHGGHRETDLAMLRLFGAPGLDVLLAAYEEAAPLGEGGEERVALWQLQPLLVHAALFGGSYGAAVERAARRYL